jgi:hypothetical protein
MSSEVSICNQALSWLGGNLISSLEDGTQEANLCRANYEPLRDAVLQNYDWTFAIRREKWPASVEEPAFGYGKQYPIKEDCLKIIEVTSGGSNVDWFVEGQNVITDVASIEVRYVARVTNTNNMSPMFRSCLATRIAAEIALPLTSTRSLQNDMFSLFERKLSEAVTADAMQGSDRRVRSRWLHRTR